MGSRSLTEERGGEIRSHLPLGLATAGGAVGAFLAGGFILVITVAFGAVLGGVIGTMIVAGRRMQKGEDLGGTEVGGPADLDEPQDEGVARTKSTTT